MHVAASPAFSIPPFNQKTPKKVQFGLSSDGIADLETMLNQQLDHKNDQKNIHGLLTAVCSLWALALPAAMLLKIAIEIPIIAVYFHEKRKIDFYKQSILEAFYQVSDAIHEGNQVKDDFQKLNTNDTISVFRLHKKSKVGRILPAMVSNNEDDHKTLKLLTSMPHGFKPFDFKSPFSGAYSLVTQTSDGKNQRHSVSKMGQEAPSQYCYEEIKFDKRDEYPSMTDDATYYYILMLNQHYPKEWFNP